MFNSLKLVKLIGYTNGKNITISPINGYLIDLTTGLIYKSKKDKIVLVKQSLNNHSRYTSTISILNIDGIRKTTSYLELVTHNRIYYGILSKNVLDNYLYILPKDNNYSNAHIDNIVYGDYGYLTYYRYHDQYLKYAIGMCSCLKQDKDNWRSLVLEEIEKGLMPTVKINTGVDKCYLLNTNGIIYNCLNGKFKEPGRNSKGYATITYLDKTGINTTHNVTRILGEYFANVPMNDIHIAAYDAANDNSREIPEIKNIKYCKRSERTAMYHNKEPLHYDKYLKNHTINNRVKVSIDGIVYESIHAAAKVVYGNEMKKGYIRKYTSVLSNISLRVNKPEKNKKKLYQRYIVKRISK